MLTKRSDQFGKNLLQGTLVMCGEALTEQEIPPTDSMRIDLWFVPDDVKRRVAPPLKGVLADMAAEPAVIELWSDAIDERELLDCLYKRHAWLRVLEMRDKRVWSAPTLWHICAGKPKTVIDRFGFTPIGNSSGCYCAAPGLRMRIVVVGELPKARETLLLRLLGRRPVRRMAMRELNDLTDDAWEKPLAQVWLERLRYEVPDPATLVDREDREFVMDITEIYAWHAELKRKEKAEYRQELEAEVRAQVEAQVKRELEAQVKRELEDKLAQDRVHLFEHRLGRSLTKRERTTLATRVKELGAEHVGDVLLDLPKAELTAWLKKA
jgi:hypothetical protein